MYLSFLMLKVDGCVPPECHQQYTVTIYTINYRFVNERLNMICLKTTMMPVSMMEGSQRMCGEKYLNSDQDGPMRMSRVSTSESI